jgi:hypothetical protein
MTLPDYSIGAYEKGKKDYNRGKHLRDNPYKNDSYLRDHWRSGWSESEGFAQLEKLNNKGQ